MRPLLVLTAALLIALGCGVRDVELSPPDGAGPAGGDEATRALFAPSPDRDVTGERGLRVVYPSDGTMFPRNPGPTRLQWSAPEGVDRFEVRLDSELVQARFYTRDRSLLLSAAELAALADQHAGRSLQLSVRGVAHDDPGVIYRSQAVTLHYSRSQVLGAIYYWSTAASGVMRAHIEAASSTKFFTDPLAPDRAVCVGCHTVSRDGRRLAAGYDGERLREIAIPTREVLIPRGAVPGPPMGKEEMPKPPGMMPPMTMPEPMMMPPPEMRGPEYGWGTFDPSGTRLLYADKGKLSVIDADSGEPRGMIALPEGASASHPDWSPDGRFVAVSYVTKGKLNNKEVKGSSIARLAVLENGTFGPPEVLVQSEGDDDTLSFPAYSPDGRWLAFVRSHGKSKDNVTAELYVVAADGQSAPIALGRANHRVRDQDDVADTGSTMPTWAPNTRLDTFWLAFSSVRDYGEQLVGAERDQLWAVAVDPERLAQGQDPSYAAFWLPFQDPAENNHRAFWTLAAEDECPSAIEMCDGLDNDCDGVVDEDCCTPAPEVCGDELDNDCNGVADEQCTCGTVDICDNLVDDDCDLEVDEDCVL